jgi:hypothetical protein
MGTGLGGFGQWGSGTLRETEEREIYWGGDRGKGLVLEQSDVYASTMRDAGSSVTTDIRPGLMVGRRTATGFLEEWDADETNGTQDFAGIVPVALFMLDPSTASAVNRAALVSVRAPYKAGQITIEGAALVGHVDEYQARRVIHGAGGTLDDDPQGYKSGMVPRYAQVTGTSDTLTAAQTGGHRFYTNAASVNVVLPTIQAGLRYLLVRTGAEEFIITSAEGDNIVGGTDAAANSDTVTWTTADEHVGAGGWVEAHYNGTGLVWTVTHLNGGLTSAYAG